jgi:hypothetical protein
MLVVQTSRYEARLEMPDCNYVASFTISSVLRNTDLRVSNQFFKCVKIMHLLIINVTIFHRIRA